MEIENIQRMEKRRVVMSIRTTKEIREWMKENNVSPSALFHEAVKELMERTNGKHRKQQAK